MTSELLKYIAEHYVTESGGMRSVKNHEINKLVLLAEIAYQLALINERAGKL